MTSSNAKVITEERKEIVMTNILRKKDLRAQKLAGAVMLVITAAATAVCGEISALIVIAPMALAAVFSREKLMDFGIFARKD